MTHPESNNTTGVEPFAQSISQDEADLVLKLQEEVKDIVQSHPPHTLFCTYGTYVRYLRARQWNLHKAGKMLKDTLAWRAEYKPEEITWEEIQSEAELKKVTILDNVDNDGRPVVFMRPRNEVPGGSNELKLKYVVYVMERASSIADAHAPDGKMTWLLDYVGYTRSNQPPWKVSLSTLSIVQNHYPERLGRAVNFKPPLLFEIFWKAIRPFVDPVTKEKLVFLSSKMNSDDYSAEMEKYFNLDHIDECMGGTLDEGRMIPEQGGYRERMKELDETITKALTVVV